MPRPPTRKPRLFRKGRGKEAKLCFMGHALMENRHGLFVDSRVSEANGTAERDMAQAMVTDVPGRHRITAAVDKNFDTAGFVAGLQELNATPHVAQNTSNRLARRSTGGRHAIPGYTVSQRIRKRIEEGFGWIKEVALQRRTRLPGQRSASAGSNSPLDSVRGSTKPGSKTAGPTAMLPA